MYIYIYIYIYIFGYFLWEKLRTQRALDVGTTLKISLEQRHNLI